MTVPSSNFQNFTERFQDQMLQMTNYHVPSVVLETGSLGTGNTFGTSVPVYGNGKALVILDAGAWTATVFLQLSLSTATSSATWYDLASYTDATIPTVKMVELGVACSLRVGIKTGGHTSGTCDWAIKAGGRP